MLTSRIARTRPASEASCFSLGGEGFVRVMRQKGRPARGEVEREKRKTLTKRRALIRSSTDYVFRKLGETLTLLPSVSRRLQFLGYFTNLFLDAQWFQLKHLDIGVGLLQYYLGPSQGISRFVASYGDHERQKLEVHFHEGLKKTPVVLFIPGGAWAAPDYQTYALLGRTLAQQGIANAVMSYRGFPFGSVEEMIEDVDLATEWLLANAAEECGGDPNRLIVFGHSAGAHLAFMNLLRRFHRQESMPLLFIGSCGVYDITHHYSYEAWRGVSELSTMKPAMMMTGKHFQELSPTAILRETTLKHLDPDDGDRDPNRRHTASVIENLALDGLSAASRAGLRAPLSLVASEFPLCILQTSGSDSTVPWHTSAEFYNIL